jgi:methyl-accepting chemotaxis protein
MSTNDAANNEVWNASPAVSLANAMSTAIIIADTDNVIRFVNKAATTLFRRMQNQLREELPSFDVNNIVGQSVDVFHKNPSHQEKILSGMSSPHNGVIDMAQAFMGLTASPVKDETGKKVGYMVELVDRTEERASQASEARRRAEFDRLLDACEAMSKAHDQGHISHMIDVGSFELDQVKTAGKYVNDMVQAHIDTKKMAMGVVAAFGRGDFDADMPRLPAEKIFLNNVIDEVRGNFRSVTKEVRRLSDAIVSGDLAVDVDSSKFPGEYAELVDSFDRVFSSLNNSFSSMAEQVTQVSQTVDQMSDASKSLSMNSQIASTSVDEVSASAEETDQQVKSNAESAQQAAHSVGSAAQYVDTGSSKIKEMVVAMDGIKTSSQDIAKIIKVIDEIAFQTNLLALNAAVEAARAGQHGRGFAVVAQEVRNLAGRSAKAARETSDLIEDASSRVNSGVRIADETSEAFSKISAEIDQVKGIVESIDRASEEQSRGVAQISQAIAEIAKTSLATSQQADELASTSSQMHSTAQQMTTEIQRFKLRASGPNPMSYMTADQLTPEMMAQLQRMMGGSKPAAKTSGRSGASDQDARGFGAF